ncbi:NAD(P)H-quinone oxidoreductase [Pseudomonas asiatica]|uniref:NAD(P)H-quinone oxidoreductase n=1 Tax=Pseudomonas asiatica TaxID=2219225 RepID=UPI00209AABAF|nr:NAD(P)H-quinone oxidoreductase [Pseudomonas asiatica]MCO7535988.1 NAD(P)H-quinone oxidoreductase [Pseudomonas asiatica]MCO7549584.1 NAD(P)H-quinone oxidoreductase [Pseudomonas asiatica]MCO7559712.1 NAD(P)H-quinone oxidoreductase [Pseudomonas asiatica]
MNYQDSTAYSVCFDTRSSPAGVSFDRHALPALGSQELLLRTMATALNRADLLQREGRYQPAPGETQVPGVEVSGEVVACGSEVKAFRPGDRVFGVVPGGGFSTHCIIDEGMAMAVPHHWSYVDAAAVAEAGLTADTALFSVGQLQPGQDVLIHAAASGVGSMAVQMVRLAGGRAICTTGSPDKVKALYELGAHDVLCGHGSEFAQALSGEVDLVVDFVGGRYFAGNLAALRAGGTLAMVGLLDRFEWQANFVPIINKRLNLQGVVLRKRPLVERRQVTRDFVGRWSTAIAGGLLKPVIGAVFPFADVERALELMENNRNIGKVVLNVGV